jgi:serpin B
MSRSVALWLLGVGLLAASLGAVGYWYYGRPEPEPELKVPPEDVKALVDGNSQFAIELYKKVAEKQDGNIVMSPYSISSALAMTYAGARGQTAEEMKRTLHFTLPHDRLHPAFGGTTEWLKALGNRKPSELRIANALWAQQGLGFVPEFLDITGKSYGAGLREVDFMGDREAARGTINRWVEEQTRDKIKDLLQPKDLTSNVRLVLTNAIYFKGEWKHKFDKRQTYDGDFETTPEVKVKVPMMRHYQIKLRTAKTDTWQLLELPYAGDRLAMVVLLPVKRCGLREAESRLTLAALEQGLAQLSEKELDIFLPRFQFTSRFELKQPLVELGMPTAFSDAADFSGITRGGGLQIKDVIHGGSIEVDEVGTVAAAATHTIVDDAAKPAFQANHPFLFLIRDTKAGNTLFFGRVAHPR